MVETKFISFFGLTYCDQMLIFLYEILKGGTGIYIYKRTDIRAEVEL